MKNKKGLDQRYYALAVLALSLVFSVIYTVLLSKFYETDVHFFKFGAAGPTVFLYAVFILTAAMIIIGFFNKKANGFDSVYHKATPFSAGASVFTGLILAVASFNEIFSFIKPTESALEQMEKGIAASSPNAAPFDLTVPIIIFSLISAVYFILRPFVKKIEPLGIVFIIRMIMYIVQGYFSKTTPLNSPVRVMEQMSCVAIMIYFVYEVRFIAGEDRPKHYLTFAPAAIFLTALSSVSEIICTFTGLFKFNGDTYSAVLRFGLMLYMISCYLPFVLSGKYDNKKLEEFYSKKTGKKQDKPAATKNEKSEKTDNSDNKESRTGGKD